MVNQQIFLPMIPNSAPIVINIAQYDYDAAGYAGRLFFNLVSNGTAYDMNGATALFQGEKPDGTSFAYMGTVVNSSVVRVNVRQQMTTVAGRVVCNLVLNNSEGQIGSYNVWLEVQESATAGANPSQTDIPALVAQAKQYADDAEAAADEAASYTGHPAYIGANNNWFVYDTDTAQYVDSGVSALGEGIVSITKTATVGLVDTYTITYTGGGTTTFDVTNGAPPNITITAQADALSSLTPTVNVTAGGTLSNPTYDLAFSGLKGETGATGAQGPTGPTGNGITSITKTGTSGLVDTYTITFSNGTFTTYTVTNGQDGTGAGDMTQLAYDPTLAVFNAGGIVNYVSGVLPTPVAVIDNLTSTSSTDALSANQGHELSVNKQDKLTEGDGINIDPVTLELSVDLLAGSNITITPQASGALRIDSTGGGGGSQTLAGLTDVTITAPTDDELLTYDNGEWVNKPAPTGGHEMITATEDDTDVDTIAALSFADASQNKVVNAYTIKKYSNVDCITLLATATQGTDTIGDWEADGTWETGSRAGWLWHKDLYLVLSDNSIKGEPIFDVAKSETVSMYAWRIDDEVFNPVTPAGTEDPQAEGWYESDGATPPTYTLTTDTTVQAGKTYYMAGGAMAVKLNGAIQSASGVSLGISLKRQRTQVSNFTVLA